MTAAATLDDVSMRFRGQTAVDGVTPELREDCITGLLGRNGAGKTTLMQLLTGHRVPTSGRVRVFGEDLLAEFDLPRRRAVKKLSRGLTSMVGIVVGLASQAPLTFFDEPYLGLGAVARQQFYDHLIADYAEHRAPSCSACTSSRRSATCSSTCCSSTTGGSCWTTRPRRSGAGR